MNYAKPEILILGDANHVIQECTSKSSTPDDGTSCGAGPAYDLDE